MPPEIKTDFPFLTREMLKFQQGASFSLIVKSRGRAAGTVTIAGATREGTFTLKHTPSTDTTEVVERFSLSDIPLMFTVLDDGNLFRPKELYIAVYLGINTNEMWQLAGGYVFGTKGLTWPTNVVEPPQPDFIGAITSVSSNDPAAGANWTYSTAGAVLTHVKGLQFTLVTDATVASRRVHIRFQDGNGQEIECLAATDQLASQTRKYTCMPVGALLDSANDNDIIIPIPADIWMRTGAVISSIFNLQAGDNAGPAEIWVEEFIMVN